MKAVQIAIFHNYEIKGSGSNEYTRYLARFLAKKNDILHIICRTPNPAQYDFVKTIKSWNEEGLITEKIINKDNNIILHELPMTGLYPVYVTDKQRSGNVKTYSELTDFELTKFRVKLENILDQILRQEDIQILHCNHLVFAPVIAMNPCQKHNIPYVIYPHGSSIEYTIRKDNRYKKLAKEAIQKSAGLIIGNNEVKNRIITLYPELADEIEKKSQIVGVGVDTSLFNPIENNFREDSINKFCNLKTKKGKPPHLTQELFSRIDHGDFSALTSYRTSYIQEAPDKDIQQKLQNIDWKDNFNIIFVGALTSGKGLQSLIAAMGSVVSKHRNINLIIVGAGAYREVLEAEVHFLSTQNTEGFQKITAFGFDLDSNEETGPWQDVKSYLSRIKYTPLEKNIHFLGRLNHPQLKFIFPCCDLAIFPSIIPEAYPLVLMESLANGVFPMTSYFSGFKDSIDNLCHYLPETFHPLLKIPMENEKRIDSISKNILALYEKKNELIKLKKNFRKLAVDQFDWVTRASQMQAAYLRILENQRG
jgi:glycosyltransferase involved in cell wall biosynthesis